MDWSFQQCFRFLYAFCSLHDTILSYYDTMAFVSWEDDDGLLLLYKAILSSALSWFSLILLVCGMISVCLVFSWLPGTLSMVLNASKAAKNFNLLTLSML